MQKNIIPTEFEELKPFSPLEVKIRENDNFEEAVRRFKSIVQKSQILSEYKAKQSYEKPSEKKRRKRREAAEKRRITEIREEQIANGEWDKKQKRKEQKKLEKINKRQDKLNDEN